MEKKIAFLRHVSGHTYDTVYDLVFTTERMLALIVWHPGDVRFKFGMMDMFIGGQFARRNERAARVGLMEERRTLHEEKRLDEVIGLHRLNFEVPYRSVASVEVKRGLFRSYLEFRVIGASKTERTVRFTLTKGQAGDAQAIVAEVMAGRPRSNDALARVSCTTDPTP
ncbi:MAG TPA: hypothetical protein VLW86_06020 [Syntrophorhabdales bacterium]|nr:hypothetical protein [Syntrophorhabdales bacterium]